MYSVTNNTLCVYSVTINRLGVYVTINTLTLPTDVSISTNTQLIQQQDDIREKHSLEIQQLNHNYETLRKTLQHLNL